MNDVILNALPACDKVSDILSIQWNLQVQCVLDRPDRGNSMNGGSDPADPLGKNPGIPGVATLQDNFNAAPHLPGRPGIDHFAVVDLTLNFKMTFNPGNGIDDDSLGHLISPLYMLRAYSRR